MSDEAAEAVEAAERPPEPEYPAAPPPEPTGDPRVDAVLARLGDLAGRPVSEHVEVFEDVHRNLQELLISAESAPDGGAGGPDPAGAPVPPRPRSAFPDALRPRA
ncbi:hypothetical protein [Actinomadura sp. WAC 06369]|uniref:hypothetical protein n=2 Tax=Actinomadura TaxID=1988 RepID=UPI00047E60A9|nr:hypothetical protein [Actinomadura sp. WAC 06369]RSN69409.1 hypothetical protein DMH08_08585 [Actinomadura sp. WAC 06369]